MAHRFPSFPLPLALALALGTFVAGCDGAENAEGTSNQPAPQPAEDQLFDLSEIGYDRGGEDADVRVIEFSDFGCVHCQRFHAETYPALHDEFVETGKVIWKYIPISIAGFPNADEAALAAECAGEQDRFFEAAEVIYERARDWTEAPDPDPVFLEIAEEAGLDEGRFQNCYGERALMDRVEANRRLASQIGIRGTPTFVVNGMPVQGAPPLDAFREALQEMVEAGDFGRD